MATYSRVPAHSCPAHRTHRQGGFSTSFVLSALHLVPHDTLVCALSPRCKAARACTQEKVQGLETQVEQLQQELQAVQLENVHDEAQLQVCQSETGGSGYDGNQCCMSQLLVTKDTVKSRSRKSFRTPASSVATHAHEQSHACLPEQPSINEYGSQALAEFGRNPSTATAAATLSSPTSPAGSMHTEQQHQQHQHQAQQRQQAGSGTESSSPSDIDPDLISRVCLTSLRVFCGLSLWLWIPRYT